MLVFTFEEKTSVFWSDPSHPVFSRRAKLHSTLLQSSALGQWNPGFSPAAIGKNHILDAHTDIGFLGGFTPGTPVSTLSDKR